MTDAPGVIRLAVPDGRPASLSLAADSTSFGVDDVLVSSYDLEGRPYALVRRDGTYRRALDGRLLHKARRGGTRIRAVLDAGAGTPVVEAARSEARDVLDALTRSPGAAGPRQAEATARLERIVANDPDSLAGDAGRYAQVYRRIGILPPDQYLALVVQVTEGCSWNACTFCDLYRDTAFHVKTPAQLDAHLRAVLDYFGAGVRMRRGVFVADANALCVAGDRLQPLLQAVVTGLAGQPVAGREAGPRLSGPVPDVPLASFVDAWTGHRKGVDEYRTLARLGLRRVYVGLETGDPELLEWLEKPGTPDDAVELVRTLHEAGIAVGVIVLLGAGGHRHSRRHVGATAAVLARMRLGSGDLLYFSEFVPSPGLAYLSRADAADLEALDGDACAAQRESILETLHAHAPDARPRVATYDVREFVY